MPTAKKLPSGSWRCQVFSHYEYLTDEYGKPIIDSKTNKQKCKRIYESFTSDDPSKKGKKEAELMAAEFALNKKAKIKIDITFKEAREKYCESKSSVLSPSTLNGYKQMNTYYESIDNIKLSKLTQEHVQLWVNKFASTHSPKTVHNAHGFISAVLKSYAPDLVLNTTLPQKIAPIYYVPSDDDIKIIIDYLREHDTEMLKAVCLSAFGTLRRSEICGLNASDVKENTIHVHKALVKNVDKKLEIKTTKTTSSSRYITMPEFVIEMLPKNGPIVSITPDAITRRFFRTLDKLKIKHFRFHDLRHYSASIMHAIGIPDQYIMARGGWGSDKVLKAIYRGTIDDYQKRFTDLTNNHFDELCNTKCNTKK